MCLTRVAESAHVPFAPAERLRLSGDQLARNWRLACQLKADDFPESAVLHVDLSGRERGLAWRSLRSDEYTELPAPTTLRSPIARLGVAIDLGTTHIRLSLWNLQQGVRLAGEVGPNPQGSYGVDVLTRLMEAVNSPQTATELQALAMQAIGESLQRMAASAGIGRQEVGEVLVVGNTAMLTLLASQNFQWLMQPENWDKAIPCEVDEPFMRQAWQLAPHARVRLIAPLGGFIGSDLLAGVLASGLTRRRESALLIDFGTNSEMALWNGTQLTVTSAAGGPAFEGSGISCGMPGENGAIYRVKPGDKGEYQVSVLGGGQAKGVCSSGLVDAVALLRQAEHLDKVGRFRQPVDGGWALSEGIVLKHGDIDVLQRAKAAIGAGVRWLCDQAGLPTSALQSVYVTGAFGKLLHVAHAQQIGLLPRIPAENVHLAANLALAGCEMLLLSGQRDELLDEVIQVAEVHNLADNPIFEELFVENLYLQAMHA